MINVSNKTWIEFGGDIGIQASYSKDGDVGIITLSQLDKKYEIGSVTPNQPETFDDVLDEAIVIMEFNKKSSIDIVIKNLELLKTKLKN